MFLTDDDDGSVFRLFVGWFVFKECIKSHSISLCLRLEAFCCFLPGGFAV